MDFLSVTTWLLIACGTAIYAIISLSTEQYTSLFAKCGFECVVGVKISSFSKFGLIELYLMSLINVCKLFDDRIFNNLVISNLTFYPCIYIFAEYKFITIFYKYKDTDFPEVNNIHV